MLRTALAACVLTLMAPALATAQASIDYRVLATSKTSTMQKDMNDAAADGFRYGGVMGGETSFGGSEVVVVMHRAPAAPRYEYRLLATSKTSTMEKEMQEAADGGFEYRGQTVFESTFGGKEVVVILEREAGKAAGASWEYRLLATKKTGTLQKELAAAGAAGYEFVGMTVARTLVGGSEIVAILRRPGRTSAAR